jgi:hypothetical protein
MPFLRSVSFGNVTSVMITETNGRRFVLKCRFSEMSLMIAGTNRCTVFKCHFSKCRQRHLQREMFLLKNIVFSLLLNDPKWGAYYKTFSNSSVQVSCLQRPEAGSLSNNSCSSSSFKCEIIFISITAILKQLCYLRPAWMINKPLSLLNNQVMLKQHNKPEMSLLKILVRLKQHNIV